MRLSSENFFSLSILSQWWKMSLVMLFKNRVSKNFIFPNVVIYTYSSKKKKNNQ